MFKAKEWIFAVLDSSKQYVVQENNELTLFISYYEAHKCFGHPCKNDMTNQRKFYPKHEGFYYPACTLAKSTHKSVGMYPMALRFSIKFYSYSILLSPLISRIQMNFYYFHSFIT